MVENMVIHTQKVAYFGLPTTVRFGSKAVILARIETNGRFGGQSRHSTTWLGRPQHTEGHDFSTPKAMTYIGFLTAKARQECRSIKPVRMVVMGGLEPPTPAL